MRKSVQEEWDGRICTPYRKHEWSEEDWERWNECAWQTKALLYVLLFFEPLGKLILQFVLWREEKFMRELDKEFPPIDWEEFERKYAVYDEED